MTPFPDLAEADVAYPMYKQPGIQEDWIAKLDNTYIQPAVRVRLYHTLVAASSHIMIAVE